MSALSLVGASEFRRARCFQATATRRPLMTDAGRFLATNRAPRPQRGTLSERMFRQPDERRCCGETRVRSSALCADENVGAISERQRRSSGGVAIIRLLACELPKPSQASSLFPTLILPQ